MVNFFKNVKSVLFCSSFVLVTTCFFYFTTDAGYKQNFYLKFSKENAPFFNTTYRDNFNKEISKNTNENLNFKINSSFNVSEINKTHHEPIDVVYTWVNGSDPLFSEELSKYSKLEKRKNEFSTRRFRDKNELKFSLRSLEKYAPWVNHVYIVTNGQVPYWLNTSYEKVTVVPHKYIFKNTSNLPTFSSPAIESNLHRIPGVSKKFIYFNDDVFVAKPLFLDDFYKDSKGYLIYLAWTVPNCAKLCPWTRLANGKCNKPCDNAECQFDGGDCSENHKIPPYDSKAVENPKMEAYTASMVHTQRLLNLRYGFKERKVAAHAPILIDRDIMDSLQNIYPKEFAVTESHRFRGLNDMQFSFSYYYFLMSEKNQQTIEEIFDEFDADHSSSWSDTEIRNLLIKMNGDPLKNETYNEFLNISLNCLDSDRDSDELSSKTAINYNLTLSQEIVTNCPLLAYHIEGKMGSLQKYKYEVVKQPESSYVTFNMITSNVKNVKKLLEKIKSKLTKFVCLNDDLDDGKSNDEVEQVLQDFYISLFPQSSAFELQV